MVQFRQYIPLMLLVVLVVLSFIVVKPLWAALFLGALMAFAFYPVYRWFGKKLNPSLAALLVCFLVLLIIIVPGFFFVQALVKESFILFTLVKQKLAVGLFRGCETPFCNLIESLSSHPLISSHVKALMKTAANMIERRGSDFLISIPKTVLTIFVIFFTMFYFLKDGKQLMRAIGTILSMHHQKYTYVLNRLKDVLHGVIYGYLLVALIQGVLGALGFFLFGLSSPLFWGIVMAFLALIPYLGTGLVWATAAAILFLDGVFSDSNALIFKGIGLFIYGLVLISGADNLLRPKLMGHKAKIHPAIIFVGILGGTMAFGVLGVLAGPIILSLTLIMINLFFYPPEVK